MKQKTNFILVTALLAGSSLFFSCKKSDKKSAAPITASFTEEFISVPGLNAKGWVMINKTTPHPDFGAWKQGSTIIGKGGPSGITAYSYTTDQSEFIAAMGYNNQNTYDISSWLITPLLKVKNGDKISFYTTSPALATNVFSDRLQVFLNPAGTTDVGNTSASTGGFTTVLFDINSGYTVSGYPQIWTACTHTFSGISGTKDIRIGFRYFVPQADSANMIGIDQFKFESQ